LYYYHRFDISGRVLVPEGVTGVTTHPVVNASTLTYNAYFCLKFTVPKKKKIKTKINLPRA